MKISEIFNRTLKTADEQALTPITVIKDPTTDKFHVHRKDVQTVPDITCGCPKHILVYLQNNSPKSRRVAAFQKLQKQIDAGDMDNASKIKGHAMINGFVHNLADQAARSKSQATKQRIKTFFMGMSRPNQHPDSNVEFTSHVEHHSNSSGMFPSEMSTAYRESLGDLQKRFTTELANYPIRDKSGEEQSFCSGCDHAQRELSNLASGYNVLRDQGSLKDGGEQNLFSTQNPLSKVYNLLAEGDDVGADEHPLLSKIADTYRNLDEHRRNYHGDSIINRPGEGILPAESPKGPFPVVLGGGEESLDKKKDSKLYTSIVHGAGAIDQDGGTNIESRDIILRGRPTSILPFVKRPTMCTNSKCRSTNVHTVPEDPENPFRCGDCGRSIEAERLTKPEDYATQHEASMYSTQPVSEEGLRGLEEFRSRLHALDVTHRDFSNLGGVNPTAGHRRTTMGNSQFPFGFGDSRAHPFETGQHGSTTWWRDPLKTLPKEAAGAGHVWIPYSHMVLSNIVTEPQDLHYALTDWDESKKHLVPTGKTVPMNTHAEIGDQRGMWMHPSDPRIDKLLHYPSRTTQQSEAMIKIPGYDIHVVNPPSLFGGEHEEASTIKYIKQRAQTRVKTTNPNYSPTATLPLPVQEQMFHPSIKKRWKQQNPEIQSPEHRELLTAHPWIPEDHVWAFQKAKMMPDTEAMQQYGKDRARAKFLADSRRASEAEKNLYFKTKPPFYPDPRATKDYYPPSLGESEPEIVALLGNKLTAQHRYSLSFASALKKLYPDDDIETAMEKNTADHNEAAKKAHGVIRKSQMPGATLGKKKDNKMQWNKRYSNEKVAADPSLLHLIGEGIKTVWNTFDPVKTVTKHVGDPAKIQQHLNAAENIKEYIKSNPKGVPSNYLHQILPQQEAQELAKAQAEQAKTTTTNQINPSGVAADIGAAAAYLRGKAKGRKSRQ